jgi:acetylornithine/N-succinyldiaminopimelate aminotransferase
MADSSSFDSIVAREAAHFLPVVNRLPVALVSGRGSRVRDVAGKDYVDLTGGWGVTAIGHCHPALVDAIADQAGRLMQTTNLFYTLPQLDLIEKLDAITPAEITRSFLVSSGAEAVEGALKLAHKATGRRQFVATHGSFHGRTLGGLSVIGQAKHRERYAAILPEQEFVPYGDLGAAKSTVGEQTAAIIVEPVQGEGGVNVPPEEYLPGLRDLCDRTGALLIADEIQTGIGRTGRWLAVDYSEVTPDILTLGKGLGGGFPVAAFLCTENVAASVEPGDHGGTYAGNPLAAAAANTVLRIIEEDGLIERAATLGEQVRERMAAFATQNPGVVTTIRGRGLLVGMELADEANAASIPKRALAEGVLVNVTAGRVVRLFPALNIPEDDLWPALDTVFQLARP